MNKIKYDTKSKILIIIPEDKVTLISKEQEQFIVKKDVAMFSFNSNYGRLYEENQELEIPLLNVSSKALIKVLEFCQYHNENGPMKEIEKPLTDTDLKCFSEWDGTFIQSLNKKIYLK